MTTPTTQHRPLNAIPILPTFLQEKPISGSPIKSYVNTMQVTQISEGREGTSVDLTNGRKNVLLADTKANNTIIARVFNQVV